MDGGIPFRVAIVTVVVGLLAVTCGALIAYGLYANQAQLRDPQAPVHRPGGAGRGT